MNKQFLPGMQRLYITKKFIKIVHQIYRPKKKILMVISKDVQKAFNKIEHP